jgi:flagellar biosynthesis/type III secretory pathway chaperone
MNNVNHLAEVMTTEAEIAEQLADVFAQQQRALVACDAETVVATVDQQQELMLPLEGLEQERERLTRELWQTVTAEKTNDVSPVNLSKLLERLDAEDASRLSKASSRLLSAVEKMMKLNQANQFLIEHSRKFVRETLRIVTNDYARPLVDRTI